ncbi:MAG: O-antigen ligase family protein [Paludibacteraceae bacterium]|nr:O-antigen ligase family protein [Paludibacteraceae bacterium]
MSHTRHLKYTDIQELHKSVVLLFNLVYIFAYISRLAIEKYVLRADDGERGILVLTILALVLNLPEICRLFLNRSRPACIIWLLLTAYSLANSMLMGFTAPNGTFVFIRTNFTEPLAFLMVATCMMRKHRQKTLVVMLSSFLFFVIIGTINIDWRTNAYGRFLNQDMGNVLPLYAVPTTLIASILRHEETIKKSYVPILLIAVIPILLGATRKAFAAVLVIFVSYLLCHSDKKRSSNIILLAIMLYLTYIGVTHILEHTLIGERFASTFRHDAVSYPLFDNPFVNRIANGLVGDRAVMYYKGTLLFAQHPINGIGLQNYGETTGDYYLIHSEYIVQLCENGIIGFALLSAFIGVVLYGLTKTTTRHDSWGIVLGGFLSILIINFTAWTYNTTFAMVVYAIVLSTIYPNTKTIQIAENDSDS